MNLGTFRWLADFEVLYLLHLAFGVERNCQPPNYVRCLQHPLLYFETRQARIRSKRFIESTRSILLKVENYNLSYTSNMNLGTHIASRLVEIGVTDCFAVPGDFNLLLLDQLLKNPKLNMVWCCNELNAGYAADGFARKKGVGCMVTTFCVGGFSVFNAIAGAYSEDLPVIVISGGPNTNDFATTRTLHHTTGTFEFGQQYRCFREITCHQVIIQDITTAYKLIDEAISTALLHSKPVYIEVCCNLSALDHPSFTDPPVPYVLEKKHTNHKSLMAAVQCAAEALNSAVKPVLLGGVRLRRGKAQDAFLHMANKSGYATAVMPDAKGMFPESHDNYIGTYWGAVSSPFTCEIIESADVVLTAGAVWTDYSTVGYSLLLKPEKVIKVDEDRVTVCGGKTFGCIHMGDFLNALADVLDRNEAAFVNYKRMYVPMAEPRTQADTEQLHTNVLFKHVQSCLTPKTGVIAEVGDSWFNSQKLKLPDGCGYEVQMRYGSIGWSVGCTLGYALACKQEGRRVLALIGDGSFQMTAQEVSTMIRQGVHPVIVLLNNGGYTIEVEIHDGPYNQIANWNYTAFVEAINNGAVNKIFTAKVKTEKELVNALQASFDIHQDRLCFIEAIIDRDDCSKDLLEWGARVAHANGRPAVPQ